MSREAVGEAENDGTPDRPSGGRSSPTPRSIHPGFLIRMHPMRIWGLGRAQDSFRLLDFTPSQLASYSIHGVLVKMVERHRQQLHVQIGLLFTTCDYCVVTFYYVFTRNHNDPLFRTVSRVPGGPPEAPRVTRGPFPEGSRKFEEVGEGSRSFEEVREGRESQRMLRKRENVRKVRARERERESLLSSPLTWLLYHLAPRVIRR